MTTALLDFVSRSAPPFGLSPGAEAEINLTELIGGASVHPLTLVRPPRHLQFHAYAAEWLTGARTAPLAANAIDTAATITPVGNATFFATRVTGVYTDPQFELNLVWDQIGGQAVSALKFPAICFAAGNGQSPFYLPVPLRLDPGKRLFVLATDDGFGAANTIRITFHGADYYIKPYYPGMRYSRIELGALVWDFSAHTWADGAAPGQLLITQAPKSTANDYDFEGVALAIQAAGGCLIQATQSGSGMELFNRATHVQSLGGTRVDATTPSIRSAYRFPVGAEWFVPHGSSINLQVTDLTNDATAANRAVQVVLWGRKLYL